MSNENEERIMGSVIWQSQAIEAPRLSLEFVRHQAMRLNADRRRELGVMYLILLMTAIPIVAAFLLPTVKAPELVLAVRVVAVFLLVITVLLLFHLHRRAKVVSPFAGETVVTSLEAYRTELQRRRDYYAYLGSWRWLWAIVPGIAVIFVAEIVYDPLPHKLRRLLIMSLIALIGISLGFAVYRRKVREFQRELDALATLEK